MKQISQQELEQAQALLREHTLKHYGTCQLPLETSLLHLNGLVIELFARVKRLEELVESRRAEP